MQSPVFVEPSEFTQVKNFRATTIANFDVAADAIGQRIALHAVVPTVADLVTLTDATLLDYALIAGGTIYQLRGEDPTVLLSWSEQAITTGAAVSVTALGVKADETDQRQNIIAAIGLANGLPLFWPAGIYLKAGAAIPVPSNTEWNFAPGAQIKNDTGANTPVLTNADTVNGNTNIVIRGGLFDGNRTGQTAQFATLDFTRVTHSKFLGIEAKGGKRNATFPNGTNGEGICLRFSDHNEISGGYYHDNDYDGIKLRTSNYNRVVGNHCIDNGRAGIQVSFQSLSVSPPYNDLENVYSAGSNFNVITGNTCYHSTGVPTSVAPTTSGIYLHTAGNNTVSNNSIYGFRQGVGIYGASIDNTVMSNVVGYRYVDKAGLDIEGGTGSTNNRNRFIGNTVIAISGSNPVHANAAVAAACFFIANAYIMNGATGSPTRTLASTATGCRLLFESSDGTLTDSGTNNTVIGSSGSIGNAFLFGAAGDTQISRTAASVLSLGTDDVLKTGQSVTGSRPTASVVGLGAQFFDTTLNKPIWSDGTVWKDAAGTTV